MTKNNSLNNRFAAVVSKKVNQKILSVAFLGATVLLLFLRFKGIVYDGEFITNRYYSWIILLMIAQIVLSVVLAFGQGFRYWYWHNARKHPLDERQLAVRREVYEKSYSAMIALFISVGILFIYLAPDQINTFVFSDIYVPIYFFFATVPAVMAAWVRNS